MFGVGAGYIGLEYILLVLLSERYDIGNRRRFV